MSAHAPLPPSSAERWVMCPGSVQAEAEVPAKGSSEFADLGSKAHALFAYCLRHQLAAQSLTDDPLLSKPLDLALTVTRQILDARRFMVERRLKPLDHLPAVWGTADVIAFETSDRVDTIVDLKFGEALLVEANALQLGIYGLLAAHQFGVASSGLTAWIVQPRHDHRDGPARSHRWSVTELERLETFLREKAAATFLTNAPRPAGEWCQFCTAAGSCSVRQATPRAVATTVFTWFRPTPSWFREGFPSCLGRARISILTRSPPLNF